MSTQGKTDGFSDDNVVVHLSVYSVLIVLVRRTIAIIVVEVANPMAIEIK